ncbi:LOW QUALITY PROTEIN: taste receptor type 2 member 39 [Mirounga angustirostris]|uniref:LOW QUALITY PROTEIN: taste receptor type 2 member 39 n=1 Tax=Mirounga angustirostris TaxID=9716 RepID=UPI0023E41B2F|nr:LOW QUALITY PROTEIN: taste receptor type 2 member 39 [Mirounga angustirostris]
MTETCNPPENELSPFHILWILTIIGTECIVGIIANGFIMAINAAEWIKNKAVSTSGRILFFLSVSRIALQSFMMLEITFSSTFPRFYNEDYIYDMFKVSFMFLNHCSLWFAAWLFLLLREVADFSHPLFLKLKWRISRWMSWLLWLSVFISLGYSGLFSKDIYTVYCNNSFIPSSNSTKKKYFTETNMVNLVLLYNLGIFIPLLMFILSATLLIISLKRHTLHMESKATGSRDPSMEAHMGAIKATSCFLVLYIFNAVALFLYMSNTFDVNSSWNIVCRFIMAAYLAGHSILLIQDNPGLRRAWKQLQPQVHLYLKEQTP